MIGNTKLLLKRICGQGPTQLSVSRNTNDAPLSSPDSPYKQLLNARDADQSSLTSQCPGLRIAYVRKG